MIVLIKTNRKVCDDKMASIKMLGTGHGFVFDIYNTCFLLKNNKGKLNIYCNSEVAEAIPAIYSHLFPTSRKVRKKSCT